MEDHYVNGREFTSFRLAGSTFKPALITENDSCALYFGINDPLCCHLLSFRSNKICECLVLLVFSASKESYQRRDDIA